jgi:hypothetical protein
MRFNSFGCGPAGASARGDAAWGPARRHDRGSCFLACGSPRSGVTRTWLWYQWWSWPPCHLQASVQEPRTTAFPLGASQSALTASPSAPLSTTHAPTFEHALESFEKRWFDTETHLSGSPSSATPFSRMGAKVSCLESATATVSAPTQDDAHKPRSLLHHHGHLIACHDRTKRHLSGKLAGN